MLSNFYLMKFYIKGQKTVKKVFTLQWRVLHRPWETGVRTPRRGAPSGWSRIVKKIEQERCSFQLLEKNVLDKSCLFVRVLYAEKVSTLYYYYKQVKKYHLLFELAQKNTRNKTFRSGLNKAVRQVSNSQVNKKQEKIVRIDLFIEI